MTDFATDDDSQQVIRLMTRGSRAEKSNVYSEIAAGLSTAVRLAR